MNLLDYQNIAKDLNHWYHKPLGRLVLQAEQQQLESVLPNLFGHHLLQIGFCENHKWIEPSPIAHKIYMNWMMHQHNHPSVLGVPEELPFDENSIDVVFLPHILEISSDPPQLLKEVQRILTPEGVAIILSFNRYSLWQLGAWLHVPRKFWLHPRYSFSTFKLNHLLQQEGFELLYEQSFFFRPPFAHAFTLRQTRALEIIGKFGLLYPGAINLAVAKKKVVGMQLEKHKIMLADTVLTEI